MLADGRVAARAAASRLAVRSERPGVHEPEARRRQRDEHRRVLGDRRRGRPCRRAARGDQLVGVAAVALGARRADGLAAVAARLAEDPVRLGVGRPDAPLAVAVAGLDVALEADGAGAVPGGAQLRLKAREVWPARRAARARAAARDSARRALPRARSCGVLQPAHRRWRRWPRPPRRPCAATRRRGRARARGLSRSRL